jgi:hypothetical protein
VKHYLSFVVSALAFALASAGHAQSAPPDESTFESASGGTQSVTGNDAVLLRPLQVVPDLVAAAIPEPEAYALMMAGIALLGLVTRRKARR